MKNVLVLMIASILIFSACLPAQETQEIEQPEPTSTGISQEMAEKHDLTDDEVEMLEDMGQTDETLTMWIEETKSMGPGPFDFKADLVDVSGGNATGVASAAFDEEYLLIAEFEGLPHPEEGYFYEGWVVRQSPLSVLSTGKAERSLGDYENAFKSDEDLTDHDFYVLTLEPDDGDPAPAKHILE